MKNKNSFISWKKRKTLINVLKSSFIKKFSTISFIKTQKKLSRLFNEMIYAKKDLLERALLIIKVSTLKSLN